MDRYRMLLDGGPPGGRAIVRCPRWHGPSDPSVLVVSTWGGTPSERLVLLPASAAAGVVMVSVSAPGADAPATARWIEVDPDADLKEALQRVGAPFRREPQPFPRGTDRSRPPSPVAHVRRPPALAAAADPDPTHVESRGQDRVAAPLDPGAPVVAVDADDVPIIEEAGLGNHLAAAGVRWIADRADQSVSAD